jgi:hypothetical protein
MQALNWYQVSLVILAASLLLLTGACSTGGLDDPAVATERALVASLTALAEGQVTVVQAPEPGR